MAIPNIVIISTAAILSLGLIAASQIDDDLSEESLSHLNKLETPKRSDAYLYLTGIYAHVDETPEQLGQQLLAEYRKHETDDSYEVQDYPWDKMLPLPDEDLLCALKQDDCIHTLFSTQSNLAKFQTKYKTLVMRVNQFYQFNEYSTLTQPSVDEPLPNFSYINKAEDIKVLAAIQRYKDGHVDQAVDMLLNQISTQRHALTLQDTLIGKMIFIAKLSHTIDVLSIICSEVQFKLDKLPALTSQEKDLSLVAAREFGMAYQLFSSLDKNPLFFDLEEAYPGWMIRIIFKPNMTTNAAAPSYSRLKHLVTLTPSEFAELESFQPPTTSKLRNIAGNILLGMGTAILDSYVARFMDLDAKIILFNHHTQAKLTEAMNPYYAGEKAEIKNNKACFRGPLEDDSSIRCLRIGW